MPVTIGAPRGGPPRSQVLRNDRWWLQPLATVLGLLAFVAYGTWTAFRGNHYFVGYPRDYLSPFYSPCLVNSCGKAADFGHLGGIGTVSPALVILIFPMGFRLTCYYYRKAYYRSFWASPPACAVADAGSTSPSGLRSHYSGETRFPLVLQNAHRYFWYFAVLFACILTWDAVEAFRFPGGIGMGLGTLFFVINAALIWIYTLGCHACRHICGGSAKRFSRSRVRYRFWRDVFTPLNHHHQLFAWMSLIFIAWTDLYVYLVSTGAVHDPRFF
ncbi:MAG: hypothetical protein M0T79_10990 [Actinomycetota bacterium]|nr:hypothetical protein [Actinomycetota bacterium]